MCAICFATSGAWIVGLIYVLINKNSVKEIDTISLGILMGGSVVGSMYYLFSKLSEDKQLFKLPYLISLFALTHLVITQKFTGLTIVGVGVLWAIFLLLYSIRNNNYFKRGISHIIRCCKNW